MKLFNTQDKGVRQHLRNNVGEPEHQLWQRLRGSQLGVKFRRQHGIGPFIVDFYCSAHQLVIEVDGVTHETMASQKADTGRDQFMRSLGIKVLRFSNQQVMTEVDGVVQAILDEISIEKLTPP
ncbi:endonuclease domain-containing protein [Permianibacter aggregans]|uniref:Very-short-patch-repair endonuclease n=1 Tax=Permianibacter aggregans TaxID=1510150 RepID=A0A4R6UUN3_9GAMM|nr:endonuclease domain-containing protein [Permianibacter aggregans]QGX40368.1 endonuclease domain-containing protein [Permianibacter aggregans]TDQ49503.1 very-short-patch-repair endonuclease [Permianibacter aggregans]